MVYICFFSSITKEKLYNLLDVVPVDDLLVEIAEGEHTVLLLLFVEAHSVGAFLIRDTQTIGLL